MHGSRPLPRLSILLLAILLVGCAPKSPTNNGSNFEIQITMPPEDMCVEPGTTLTFLAAYSNTAGNPAARWAVDNANATVPSTTAWTFEVLFTELGTYNFTATGHDDGLLEPTDTRTITVAQYCAIFVEIDTPEEGAIHGPEEPITFSATVTGATEPVEYDWDFSENSGIPDSQEQYPTGSIADPGAFSVTLTVTDDTGATASSTVNFEVADITGVDSPVGDVKAMVHTPPNFGGSDTPGGGVLLLGLNDSVLFDVTTSTFGDIVLPGTRFFNGAAAMPGPGAQAIVGYDFQEVFVSHFDDGGSSFLTPTQLQSGSGYDICAINNDPSTGGFVIAAGDGIKIYELGAEDSDFTLSLHVGADQFPGANGTPITVAARELGGGFLACTSSSPGELWHHDGTSRTDATLIGTLGSESETLRCLDQIAVVTDDTDDTGTVIVWDASDNVSIGDTFPTGDNPESCDLMLLPSGNYACVVATRNEYAVTVAEIAPNGTVVSSRSVSTPNDCGSPNQAVWLRDGGTSFLVNSLSDTKVFVLPSGF